MARPLAKQIGMPRALAAAPGSPAASTHADDDLRVHAVLDKGLGLLQQLGGEQRHRRRAVADLGVLRARNVDQRLRRGVHHVQQLQDLGAVVGDRRLRGEDGEGMRRKARAEERVASPARPRARARERRARRRSDAAGKECDDATRYDAS